ncbi:hypothetical protein GQ53DRAFT_746151 [Thozetella sp. PMI_491]|nr:hypothetical protein GQ53DRAFT_746151 [Thozetella sp. PMI_491]
MYIPLALISSLLPLLGALPAKAAVVSDNTTWPYQVYKSSSAEPPSLEFTKAGTQSPGYLFFQQNGNGAHQYSLFIMSDTNELVWQGLYGDFTAFRTQEFEGRPVLTFFNGIAFSAPWGYGYGIFQILDDSYESIYNVTIEHENFHTIDLVDTSGFQSWLDIHESNITPQGTMLVTGYNVTQLDLSSVGGPEDGWIADSLFYEVDIRTNKILYRWRHRDHLDEMPLANVIPYYPISYFGNESYPWGPFHINSVDKFQDGSYLISSRYYCSLFKLSVDGTVEWTLDGQSGGDFTLGEGLSFAYQHDARIRKEDGNTYLISLFDNAHSDADSSANGATETSGLFIEVNAETKQATLVQKFVDPQDSIASVSQGNLQLLPNGNVIMGYGSVPKIKEFSTNGSTLVTAKFGPDQVVQSYRAYRSPWVGRPKTSPSAFACREQNSSTTQVFMSWNGATEHSLWSIYTGATEANMTLVAQVQKTGFETTATIDGQPEYIRVKAEGANITAGVSSIITSENYC